MIREEMTMADILKDPLIGQVMRADGVSVEQMERLLLKVAQAQGGCKRCSIKAGKTAAAGRSGSPRRRVFAFPDGQLPLWDPDKT